MSIRITIETSSTALEPLWQLWEDEGCLQAFQTRAFVETWLETAAPLQRRQPRLALVELDNAPIMLLPLALRPRYGLKVLEFCGGLLCDYEAPALSSNCPELKTATMQAIWKRVVRQSGAQVAHLRQVSATIPKPDGAARLNPLMLLPSWQSGKAYASCTGGLNGRAYLERIQKKRLLLDSRRQLKRLGELGTVRFVVAQTPEEGVFFTRAMIAQKRRRYAETNVFDIFSMPGHEAFYLRMAETHCSPDCTPRTHIAALLLDETILATHWGLRWRHSFDYLMPTYEGGSWQRYSCGRLLLEWLMTENLDNYCTCFDFTVGGEGYKKDWCNVEQPLYETYLPVGIWGKAYTTLLNWKRQRRTKC